MEASAASLLYRESGELSNTVFFGCGLFLLDLFFSCCYLFVGVVGLGGFLFPSLTYYLVLGKKKYLNTYFNSHELYHMQI